MTNYSKKAIWVMFTVILIIATFLLIFLTSGCLNLFNCCFWGFGVRPGSLAGRFVCSLDSFIGVITGILFGSIITGILFGSIITASCDCKHKNKNKWCRNQDNCFLFHNYCSFHSVILLSINTWAYCYNKTRFSDFHWTAAEHLFPHDGLEAVLKFYNFGFILKIEISLRNKKKLVWK